MTIKMRRRKFTGPSDSLELAVTAAYKLFGGENDEDWDDEEEWDSPIVEEITEIEIFVADKFSRRRRKVKLSEQGIFVKCADFDRVRLHGWDFDPFMWEPYDDGKSE